MRLLPRGLADEQAIPAQRTTSERSLETDFAGHLTKRAPFWRIRREYSDNAGRNTVKTHDNDRQMGDEYAAKRPNKKGAPERPYFFRSTTRESRVRNPPRCNTPRRSGS